MKMIRNIVFSIVAVVSLLLAFAMVPNWISSYREDPNNPGQHGQLVPINDYSHYLQTSDGWMTYYAFERGKGGRVVWKIPLWGLFALFVAFPAFWITVIARARVRRRSRGFEVMVPASNQTDQPTANPK